MTIEEIMLEIDILANEVSDALEGEISKANYDNHMLIIKSMINQYRLEGEKQGLLEAFSAWMGKNV